MIKKVWDKWFKDSEVNLIADLLVLVGLLSEVIFLLADDPAVRELLVSLGVAPKALIIIGIVFRVARHMRDPDMRITK